MDANPKKLVVVSNRLPVAIHREGDEWTIRSSPGGLVTALAPTMRSARGVWLGWPGCSPETPTDQLLATLTELDYQLQAVDLSEDDISRYYRGFANRSLWPLFHDLLGHFSFNTDDWLAYVRVNQRFAQRVRECAGHNSFIWVHDYQLLLVGRALRELGVTQHLAFFLHIPFPSPDLFRRLPVSRDVLEAMLQYDHIGFQTAQDKRNFIQCIKWFSPASRRTSFRRQSILRHEGRDIKLGYYPISIDFKEFNDLAQDQRVADASWYIHENFASEALALGLDRLDYTKGIPERFLAFERALDKYPELVGKLSLIQVVIPSRLNVEEYQALKNELDQLAGRINSRFSQQGWTPIHYQFRELDREQLLGHYRGCEIALITPLRDGMNLVAKEYCASQVDFRGVLVLSEFAGAARQLAKGALLVNPYDIDGTADALYAAYIMSAEERRRRMRILRHEVRRNDVRRWVQWFLSDAPLDKDESGN
ncbi:MAG: trehalose-6-phosphate synthase [candidate division Zixibacteria bacterium]|nr:trehalose-6-phosphate synthase [candidate division Zixibacteria bacterium]